METLAIGRRLIDKETLINAVKTVNSNHGKISDVLTLIGFNPTVSTTRQMVTAAINELNLDYSGIRKFGYSNKESTQKRIKTFKLSKGNQLYLDRFLNSIKPESRATYKASCGNFLQELGTNDFARVSPERMLKFAEGSKANIAHLRSMMIYCIKNNINEAKSKVSIDMAIWLIGK
jgi:hypothetical protein